MRTPPPYRCSATTPLHPRQAGCPCRPVPFALPSASAGARSRVNRAPVCCSSDLTSGWSLVGPRKQLRDGLVPGGGRRDPVFRQPAYTPPPERPGGSPNPLRRRDSYPQGSFHLGPCLPPRLRSFEFCLDPRLSSIGAVYGPACLDSLD